MTRKIVITGGSSGLGLALAQALVARGDAVALLARDERKLEVDVGSAEEVEAWANSTRQHFGQVNVIVNNAGDASVAVMTGRDAGEATEEFEKMFFTTPAQAARVIVAGVRANKRRVLIGSDARLFDWCARFMPAFYQRIFTAAVRLRSRKSTTGKQP